MIDAVIVTPEELDGYCDPQKLENAFGPDSLGIILVKQFDPKFSQLRQKVLSDASKLACLPDEVLSKLESREAMWLVGWSRGREKLLSGEYDFNKGSFYANCAFYVDPLLEGPPTELSKDYENYKAYTTSNIWPSDEYIKLFERDFKQICTLILDVSLKVARVCDKYMSSKLTDYKSGFLERIVKESTTTKARMLHYYPIKEQSPNSTSEDDWCGEHLDHSCLTGLLAASYVNERTGDISDDSPDAQAGLYIRNRKGDTVKVEIPSDCLAFQTGSALEEITRGSFKAVPHYVKGCLLVDVSRNTLAVFCQPNLHELVNDSEDFALYAQRILQENH